MDHTDAPLESKRLLLKPTTEADAVFILRLFNTPKWHRYIGDRKVHSIEDAVQYIRIKMMTQQKKLGFSTYTIIRKSDQEKVGTCGLYNREGINGIDLGFALLPEYEGLGYAWESSRIMLNAAFHRFGLDQVAAITLNTNTASQRLLEKLGLRFSGHVTLPGSEEELLLYIIKMSDYK